MATSPREGGLLEVEKQKVKPPPLYKVLLLNDDYTPMDFVVGVLQNFFGMTREQATQVMLKVHRDGMGVCGGISEGCRRDQGGTGHLVFASASAPVAVCDGGNVDDCPGTRSQSAHGLHGGQAEAPRVHHGGAPAPRHVGQPIGLGSPARMRGEHRGAAQAAHGFHQRTHASRVRRRSRYAAHSGLPAG